MGIIKTASDDLDALYLAWKTANTPNRNQRRKYMAAIVNRANEWLAKFDAQEAQAPIDFAASKQTQFNSFTDALPEPTMSTAPASDDPQTP